MTRERKTYREHHLSRPAALAKLDNPTSSPAERSDALLSLAYNDEDPAFVVEKGLAAAEAADAGTRMAGVQCIALVARFHHHVEMRAVGAVIERAADRDECVRDAAEDALADLALFGIKGRPYRRQDAVGAVDAGPDAARVQAYAAIADGDQDWHWVRDFLLAQIAARSGVVRARALASLGWCAVARWRADGVDLDALAAIIDDPYGTKILARVRLQVEGIRAAELFAAD